MTLPGPNTPASPPATGAAATRPATGSGSGRRSRRRNGGPQPFDFRRPNKFSREHVRALQIVNETFARQFTTILSTTLRAVSQVTLSSIDQVSYDEYVRVTPNPSYLAIISIDPLPGVGIFQLPLPIAMVTIDRLLGGPGTGAQPQRPLTEIESGLIRELVARILHELVYAFDTVTKFEPKIVALESNPQFAQIAAPSDMMISTFFDVKIGDEEAVASLCLPFAALHPALEVATAKSLLRDRTSGDAAAARRALVERLDAVPVEASVRFSPVTLTSAEILQLAVGDVLPLRHPINEPLTISAAGVPCAFAVPGSTGKRLACMIVSPSADKDSPR